MENNADYRPPSSSIFLKLSSYLRKGELKISISQSILY
jgi:hypothetical protein